MGGFLAPGREIHAIFIIVMRAVDSWSLIVASARILIFKEIDTPGPIQRKGHQTVLQRALFYSELNVFVFVDLD